MVPTTKKRQYSKKKEFNPVSNRSKQICVPLDKDSYQQVVKDAAQFRAELDQLVKEFPELFPVGIEQGYSLHDILPPSKKMPDIRLRRIKIEASRETFTIRPAFVLPYMIGYTDEVEMPLLLRRWAVPYWVLVILFGRDEDYWYRLETRLGRYSLVGTTVQTPAQLPQDLLADEKHTTFNGQKAYIATTVGQDCILGASVVLGADADTLREAYTHFKTEAQNLAPDYCPDTVNTDGWLPTHLAWQNLFSSITIILCFLHAFINIRSRCKRFKGHYQTLKTKVWQAYHAVDRSTFLQQLDELKSWATQHLPADSTGLEAVFKLCAKAPQFVLAYDHPAAYRTSNMIDRHMRPMSRYLEACQGYHGHLLSAEYSIRAWALLHNFWPYCPRAKVAQQFISPAHKLNGRIYHNNWLYNLLISASMGGYRQ